MKKSLFVVVMLSVLILTGCGTGLYFGPDATVSVSGVPTANNYTMVVINSSPFSGEVFANGHKVATLAPWSQHAVSLRRYYINYQNTTSVVFTVRFVADGKIASFARRVSVSNYYSRSESWEITSRDVQNKLRWSSAQ